MDRQKSATPRKAGSRLQFAGSLTTGPNPHPLLPDFLRTRCVGTWSALGLVGLRVASPEAGRTVTAVLATSATNDFLQAGFKALCGTADRASPTELS
jgi:Protein of unknown function (DUF1360)